MIGQGACFSKVLKLFEPISSATIPLISSQRRGSKSSDFAILLIFRTLKACSKISFSKQADCRLDSSVPLTHHDPKDLGLICLVQKRKIHFRILSDFRIQSWIFLKKRTLNVHLSLHFKERLGAKSLFSKSLFIHIEIEINYHNKNFALTLALKERLRGTRKWPIPTEKVIKHKQNLKN